MRTSIVFALSLALTSASYTFQSILDVFGLGTGTQNTSAIHQAAARKIHSVIGEDRISFEAAKELGVLSVESHTIIKSPSSLHDAAVVTRACVDAIIALHRAATTSVGLDDASRQRGLRMLTSLIKSVDPNELTTRDALVLLYHYVRPGVQDLAPAMKQLLRTMQYRSSPFVNLDEELATVMETMPYDNLEAKQSTGSAADLELRYTMRAPQTTSELGMENAQIESNAFDFNLAVATSDKASQLVTDPLLQVTQPHALGKSGQGEVSSFGSALLETGEMAYISGQSYNSSIADLGLPLEPANLAAESFLGPVLSIRDDLGHIRTGLTEARDAALSPTLSEKTSAKLRNIDLSAGVTSGSSKSIKSKLRAIHTDYSFLSQYSESQEEWNHSIRAILHGALVHRWVSIATELLGQTGVFANVFQLSFEQVRLILHTLDHTYTVTDESPFPLLALACTTISAQYADVVVQVSTNYDGDDVRNHLAQIFPNAQPSYHDCVARDSSMLQLQTSVKNADLTSIGAEHTKSAIFDNVQPDDALQLASMIATAVHAQHRVMRVSERGRVGDLLAVSALCVGFYLARASAQPSYREIEFLRSLKEKLAFYAQNLHNDFLHNCILAALDLLPVA